MAKHILICNVCSIYFMKRDLFLVLCISKHDDRHKTQGQYKKKYIVDQYNYNLHYCKRDTVQILFYITHIDMSFMQQGCKIL